MSTDSGALTLNISGRLHRSSAEAIALHETAFFRDRIMFDALRESALPRLIAAKASVRRLRILCAGVATGQEAYSLAMLLRAQFSEQLAGWDVKIDATDLVAETLEYARKARYRRAEVNCGLPARMLVRYFTRHDEEWEVAPELRALCHFLEADVCHPNTETGQFDLVLMRNVLLFLTAPERAAAFANVRKQIAPHGLLALGQAEQAEDSTNLFEPEYIQSCCFYRPAKTG